MSSLPTAIFIPTRNEAKGIFAHLKISSKTRVGRTQIYQAHSKGRREVFLIILTGIGPELAQMAAEHVFQHYNIKEAWLMGVCAATQIGYEAGDVFLASDVCSEHSDIVLKTDFELHQKAQKIFETLTQRTLSGKILTVQKIIESPEEKIFLGQKHDCLGLAMEAYPIALEAQKNNIPFLEIRWVLDPAEYKVPDVKDFVDESGNVKPLATFKHFIRKPQNIVFMIPFVNMVKTSLKQMNLFLHSFFEDGRIIPSLSFVHTHVPLKKETK